MYFDEDVMDDEKFEKSIREEKQELLDISHRIFWNSVFMDAYKILDTRKNKSLIFKNEVLEELGNFLKDLCKKFALVMEVRNYHNRTEFVLSISRLDYLNYPDELVISVGMASIEIEMRSGLFIACFSFEAFEQIEDMISSVCSDLYEKGRLSDLLYEHSRIEESCIGITFKSVEIVRNTLRAIYESSQQKTKNMEHKILYTSAFINGKLVRILHKEFMENPNPVMQIMNTTTEQNMSLVGTLL